MLKNMKLFNKMLVLAALLLILLLYQGIVSYFFLERADAGIDSLYNNYLKGTEFVNDIIANARANEADLLYIILNTDNKALQEEKLKDLTEKTETITADLVRLKELDIENLGVDAISSASKNVDSFDEARDEIIKLAMSGDQNSALEKYNENAEYMNDYQMQYQQLSKDLVSLSASIYNDNEKNKDISVISLILTFLFAAALGIIFTFVIARSITKPLAGATEHLNLIGSGDLTKQVPKNMLKLKNEMGQMTKSINNMQESLTKILRTVISEAVKSKEYIYDAHDKIAELNSEVADITGTAQQLSAGMEETAASAQEMTAVAHEIETAVNSVATKAEEEVRIAADINLRAQSIHGKATDSLGETRQLFVETQDKLNVSLLEVKRVEQLGEMYSTILGISEQTNLLALNAAIEAARAGEHGKGFSVVAEEIRKLADETKNTVSKLQQITNQVDTSVNDLVDSSNNILRFINEKVFSDYSLLIETSEQYSKDAMYYYDNSTDLSATCEQLLASIHSMVTAINEIASASGEGSADISNIAEKALVITEKSTAAKNVTDNIKESSDRMIEQAGVFTINA